MRTSSFRDPALENVSRLTVKQYECIQLLTRFVDSEMFMSFFPISDKSKDIEQRMKDKRTKAETAAPND